MTTEDRLEKLERELAAAKRRNRWLLFVLALLLGTWLVVGAWDNESAVRDLQRSQPAPNTKNDESALRAIPGFADAKDEFINTNDPEYSSQRHGFTARFPLRPEVKTHLAGTALETTAYEAFVEGRGLYKVMVNTLPKPPMLSDEAIKTFLDGYLSAKLRIYKSKAKIMQKEHALLFGKRILAYEYELLLGEETICFKGVYIISEQMGYEVGVLFPKDAKDSVLPSYRSFVSSFRISSSPSKAKD